MTRTTRATDTRLSTQERRPWRSVIRSMVQAAVPLILALPLILPVLQSWIDENRGTVLPESAAVVAGGAIAFLVSVSGLTARLMAIPAVNTWFRAYFRVLAPDGHPAQPPTEDDTPVPAYTPRRAIPKGDDVEPVG